MLSSLTTSQLAPCLLLVLLSWPGEGRPDTPVTDAQRKELLEAVKAEILSSLGMEQQPSPAQKASEEELQRVYQSYWETLGEMGGNSSQRLAEAEQRSRLHPGTGRRWLSNLSGGRKSVLWQTLKKPFTSAAQTTVWVCYE